MEDYLRHKIDVVRHLMASAKAEMMNPAGYLVKSIEENYAAPKDYKSHEERQQEEAICQEQASTRRKSREAYEEKQRKQREQEMQAAAARKTKVEGYLSALPEEERQLLIGEVIRMENAAGNFLNLKKGLLYDTMLQLAIEKHVLALLKQ